MSNAKRPVAPFFGPAPLPRTSYGYQPPREATAQGWRCTNRHECGQSHNRRIRRWPARCPDCGWPADPVFDPPWEHDALGAELKWQITHDTDEYGLQIARERLMAWHLKDARLRGDAAGAMAARTALHRYANQQVKAGNWWNPGLTLSQVVREEIDAGDFDGAAEDLCYWLTFSTGENASEDNEIRTNARSVISAGSAFLSTPAGSAHQHAAEIRAGCLRIAAGAFPELNRELQDAIMRMSGQAARMTIPFRKENRSRSDQITPDQLARFGRYLFLDSKINGGDQHDALTWVRPLASLIWEGDTASRPKVIAELHRHAAKGEWEKVGAWKFVREFLDDAPDTQGLIDGGLLAIARMRVTNLTVNLSPLDTLRYQALVGGPVPYDGFFGPPAFDSEFGPGRQYYLDSAASEAARRVIARLPHSQGTPPGSVTEAARSMWDFGLLIYRGPLVVHPDLMFEPNVVRPAVCAATGTDHAVFMEMLAAAIFDPDSHINDHAWPFLGGSRFAEDYLCPQALDTQGYLRLLDAAVGHLVRTGEPGRSVAPGALTPSQRRRLAEVRGGG